MTVVVPYLLFVQDFFLLHASHSKTVKFLVAFERVILAVVIDVIIIN